MTVRCNNILLFLSVSTFACGEGPIDPANSCEFAFDGVCDDPQNCATGTDSADCVVSSPTFTAQSSPCDEVTCIGSASCNPDLVMCESSIDSVRHVLNVSTSYVWSLDMTADGQKIATGTENGGIAIWDVGSGNKLFGFASGHRVMRLAFAPNGLSLVVADVKDLDFFDLDQGTRIGSIVDAHGESISTLAYPPDDIWTLVSTADRDNPYNPEPPTMRSWDLTNGTEKKAVEIDHSAVRMVFSAGGQRMVLAREWGVTVYSWPAATETTSWSVSSELFDVAHSPTASKLGTVHADGSTRIWSATSGSLLTELPMQQHGAAIALDWAPDGITLAVGYANGTLILWNVETGAAIRALFGHGTLINSVRYSSLGDTIATASLDGTAIIWEAGAQ